MTDKKKKMRETTIEINPYCMQLTIVQANDFLQFANKYGWVDDVLKVVGRVGFVISDEERLFAVFSDKTTPGDIVHECVHLTNEVFKWTNAKPDVDNDEPQAYLTAWFFEQIQKFIK